MDLFVHVPDIPESLGNLELLYIAVDSSSLASPGTLSIVRGARVPIVKYIDAAGSGTISLKTVSNEASKSMYR